MPLLGFGMTMRSLSGFVALFIDNNARILSDLPGHNRNIWIRGKWGVPVCYRGPGGIVSFRPYQMIAQVQLRQAGYRLVVSAALSHDDKR